MKEKTALLHVKIKQTDYETIRKSAQAIGLSVSAFVRSAALQKAK